MGLSCFLFVAPANAQLFKKMFKKKGGDKKEEVKKEPHVHSAYHAANVGKVVFYNKSIEYNSSSSGDSEANKITERVIAGSGPFSFRAYLDKPYKESCEGCDGMEIRYTMGGVSITTDEVEKALPNYYTRMASIYSYYDSKNYAVGVPLNSGPGKYYENYTHQEDTYRILLSKIKSQLTVGASLKLKVEILAKKGDALTETVLASGEITMKVTAESSNAQSLNCRCGKPGMTDEKVEKDVKEAFEFQFNDVIAVHKVVLLERDFTGYDDHKGMWANIIYERNDGVFLMIKRYIFYKNNGDGYSDKATIGKHKFFLPVSPTCAQ